MQPEPEGGGAQEDLAAEVADVVFRGLGGAEDEPEGERDGEREVMGALGMAEEGGGGEQGQDGAGEAGWGKAGVEEKEAAGDDEGGGGGDAQGGELEVVGEVVDGEQG